jgi:hypothetical protein
VHSLSVEFFHLLDQKGWWFSRQDAYFMAQDKTDCCKGYEESLEVIKKAFEEQGPFDGVLGFSQGASMVSLLCGIREQDPGDYILQYFFLICIRFASMLSQCNGFNSRTGSDFCHQGRDTEIAQYT